MSEIHRWFTDYEPSTSKWSHRVLTDKMDILFHVSVKNSTYEEFDKFITDNLSAIDERIQARLRNDYKVIRNVLDERQDDPSILAKFLPGVTNEVTHPVNGETSTLFHVIIDLNDTCKWSRDAIADWIESFDEVPVFNIEEEGAEAIYIESLKPVS